MSEIGEDRRVAALCSGETDLKSEEGFGSKRQVLILFLLGAAAAAGATAAANGVEVAITGLIVVGSVDTAESVLAD